MIQSFLSFTPQIHPQAYIHPSAVIIGQVTLAAHSSIWPQVTLRGDDGRIDIGQHSNIQDNSVCHLTSEWSNTIIGDYVTVGHGVILHGCIIHHHCLIGMGSIILDNAEIGEYCLIGAGTLITAQKKIPPRSVVLGNPGIVVRSVSEREINMIEAGWQTYTQRAIDYQQSKIIST